MPVSSSWMPYAPQGVKGLDDDDDDIQPSTAEVTLPSILSNTHKCVVSHMPCDILEIVGF
jgi:hypothetical protein